MPAVTVLLVKQVVKVRVLPVGLEAAALNATLRACNNARRGCRRRCMPTECIASIDAQRRFYAELRQRFGLSAQPAIRVIGKVADAYASFALPTFTPAATDHPGRPTPVWDGCGANQIPP